MGRPPFPKIYCASQPLSCTFHRGFGCYVRRTGDGTGVQVAPRLLALSSHLVEADAALPHRHEDCCKCL